MKKTAIILFVLAMAPFAAAKTHQFVDEQGKPVRNGTLSFYEADPKPPQVNITWPLRLAPVFADRRGKVPLELRASAVCDLYELKAQDRHAWVKAFLDALMNAPKKLWHPVILIVDEAHLFCPEKGAGESIASDAMIDLATRGRKRGFCPVFATQRLGKLRKDAASELQNVLIGGTFLDVDVKRAAETLGIPKGKDEREFAAHMKVVEPGTFIALGRAISRERVELKVGDVQTSHPKPGSAKHAAEPPPPPEKVRELLPRLADLPKEAEEKARTAVELQAKVRTLTAEVTKLQRQLTERPAAEVERIDREALAALVQGEVERTLRPIREQVRRRLGLENTIDKLQALGETLKSCLTVFDDGEHWTPKALSREAQRGLAGIVTTKPAQLVPSPAPARKITLPETDHSGYGDAGDPDGATSVTPARLRILSALAQFEAIGRPSVAKKWVAALAGASHKSSAFENNLGGLRTSGLIEYPGPGDARLTDKGRAIAPQVDPPRSAEEMLARCKQIVPPRQQNILNALAAVYPNPLDKESLAGEAKASAKSSSFENSLGSLRSAGMIEYPASGTAKLASWVMLDAA